LVVVAAASPLLIGSVGLRTQFEDRLLAAHNRERYAMSVPMLQWDPKLARGASTWAAHLSRSGKFEHSPDDPRREPVGENIWGGTPKAYAPESMVGLWIAEKRQFKSVAPGATSATKKLWCADIGQLAMFMVRTCFSSGELSNCSTQRLGT
jgi:hypothetical protein